MVRLIQILLILPPPSGPCSNQIRRNRRSPVPDVICCVCVCVQPAGPVQDPTRPGQRGAAGAGGAGEGPERHQGLDPGDPGAAPQPHPGHRRPAAEPGGGWLCWSSLNGFGSSRKGLQHEVTL